MVAHTSSRTLKPRMVYDFVRQSVDALSKKRHNCLGRNDQGFAAIPECLP